MNIILRTFTICFILSSSCFASGRDDKIAVIVPMEHRAMDEIVRGIKENDNIDSENVIVFNTMGDTNNIHAIINQIGKNPQYKAIMPIGTTATYLAIGAIQDKYIVSLASIIDEETRQQLIIDGHRNITSVYDGVSVDKILEFIRALKKRNILIVFSNDQRITDQINQIDEIKDKYNIEIHKLNISNATDIYNINSALSNIDAVFILKDHIVVSMINVITSIAHEANIPVIASDEGSIINGADIGFGVAEDKIGFIGAEILKEILDGKKPVDIPVRVIKDISVFYNKNSKIDLNQLEDVSRDLGYNLQYR